MIVSLVTVAASLCFRTGMQGASPLFTYYEAVTALALGSLAGAFVGSGLVARVDTHLLHRMVGGLLIALAAVMATHGLLPHSESLAIGNGTLLFVLGTVCGFGIGMVGSMLGVAGGEMLIPALVLVYGANIKTAGTLALSVSLPMLLMTIWRLRRLPAARAVKTYCGFIALMATGSLLGAYIGSQLIGIAPEQALSVLLAVILLVSALKTFVKK